MKQDKIEFKYKFPDDYTPTYVNGCYGGKSPKGEVIINFFLERIPIPNSETFKLSEEGSLDSRIGVKPEAMPMIRTVPCGVIMSKESAKEIYDWLGHILEVQP